MSRGISRLHVSILSTIVTIVPRSHLNNSLLFTCTLNHLYFKRSRWGRHTRCTWFFVTFIEAPPNIAPKITPFTIPVFFGTQTIPFCCDLQTFGWFRSWSRISSFWPDCIHWGTRYLVLYTTFIVTTFDAKITTLPPDSTKPTENREQTTDNRQQTTSNNNVNTVHEA